MKMKNKIDLRLGDCIEVLKTIPDNSVDSVVTDPPYGIGFMNKEWDNPQKHQELIEREKKRSEERFAEGKSPAKAGFSTGVQPGLPIGGAKEGKWFQDWCELWARECYRVLKPGGHALSFAAPRTYHRMATAFEDVGFQIRDQIMWVFGSGFPKSLNINKQIEKNYLCQFTKNAKNVENKSKLISVELIEEKTDFVVGNVVIFQEVEKENRMVIGVEVGLSRTDMSIYESTEHIEQNTILLLKNKLEENLKKGNKYITSTELKQIIDLKIWNLFQYHNTLKSTETLNGTALKPSHEPIVMARKPLSEKSIVENVLKHGTGGINIDGSRIEFEDTQNAATNPKYRKEGNYKMPEKGQESNGAVKFTSSKNEYDTSGRFPANIIFDEEAGKLLDEQSGTSKSGKPKGKGSKSGGIWQPSTGLPAGPEYGDSGGASRFFYCPKTSKKDRNEGLDGFELKEAPGSKRSQPAEGRESALGAPRANNHPTVKPTDLMRYLINLVTPKGGTTLDPFMGSGSTGKAAIRCGVNFIGIEKEQEYMEIAKARINHEKNKPIQGELY